MASEVFRAIIEILRYVTNIYALIGFLFFLVFLVCMFLIAHHHIEPSKLTKFFTSFFKKDVSVRVKRTIVFLLSVSIIFIVIFLLLKTYEKAMYEKEITIAKDNPQELYKGIEVELVDITTLKDQEYNKRLSDAGERERIYRTVFKKAGVRYYEDEARNAVDMNEGEWNGFLGGLSELSRLIIQRSPFAEFSICIGDDNDPELEFKDHYFFKGEVVSIEAKGKDAPPVRFRLKNVYDVYDIYSDEREAVVVQLVRR